MKLVISAACLAATLALASHAFADGRTVVTLQQPVAAKTEFVVDGGVWRCEAATCVASYTPDQSFGASQCHDVAKQVGQVASFQDERQALQPAALEKCNTNVAAKTITASR